MVIINKLYDSLQQANNLLTNFLQEQTNIEKIELLANKIAASFVDVKKILICGNGGSACDAMHFAEEFTGRYRKDRKPLPVISLSDPGHITCVANDYGFKYIFSRGVEAYGTKGDWFIGLTTSGNSENIINAFAKARSIGMHSLALLGKDGGKLKGVADYEFIIPGNTADRIQEIHMLILHVLIQGIELLLFPENY